MLNWDDLAFNLGGRVKSVLIVVLAAFLVAQQGMSAGKTGSHADGAVPSGSRNVSTVMGNPIDAYFGGLDLNRKGAVEELSYANIYLDSWEKELQRSYEVLEDALEKEAFCGESYIEEAENLFAGFAEAQGWLEAYAENGLSEKAGPAETGVISARKAYEKAELTKWLTMRIYGMLAERFQGSGPGWDGRFGFDESEAGKALRECGLY